MPVLDRFKKAWDVFRGYEKKEHQILQKAGPPSYSDRPHRSRLRYTNEKSIIASIFTRLSIDAAGIDFRHIKLDDQGRYKEDIDSGLNTCLTLEANLDQAPRAFKQDIFLSLFDKGAVAIVPVKTDKNPMTSSDYDIYAMRVGTIVDWYPHHVRVSVYNEDRGKSEELVLPKTICAIVENPLYSTMNEPNSTLQRLVSKLNMLDQVDEVSASGKMDLIIQLPYVIKSESRREQAEKRRLDIEAQLKGSTYGIAYTDGTEKITQLNRPAENNLLEQVKHLTELLYSQLGLTEEIMKGTADEKTMLNYFNRTVEPLVEGVSEAMRRSWLGKTGVYARSEQIRAFRDPFKLTPLNDIAEIADKFTRNEILTSNELRGILGYRPAPDPKADQLVNSNMPQPVTENEPTALRKDNQNES